MKKKTMVLGGLIAAVAITGYSVSSTYARYVSQVGGGDSAQVAKWDVTSTDSMTLFGKPANGATVDGRVAPGGTATGSFGVTIGTGMEVEFTVDASESNLENKVLVELTVDDAKGADAPVTTITTEEKTALAQENRILEKDGKVYYAPIQFTYTGTTTTTTNDLSTLAATIEADLKSVVSASGDTSATSPTAITRTIKWDWVKDSTSANKTIQDLVNALDTELGSKGTDTIEITATAIVKQK